MRLSPWLAILLVIGTATASGAAVGTAFTYQGRLTEANLGVSGSYDLRFVLYDVDAGGTPISPTLTNENVMVTNGLFTTTIDFGTGVFSGAACWLEIGVRTGASTGNFALLNPRQPVTPAPYAMYAPNAASAASVPWSGLTGVPSGFLDGLDNDTTYSAGPGIALTGSMFAIAPGGVVESMLANAAVTASKIASSAVTTSALEDDAVTEAKLNEFSVTASKIFDGAVTEQKIDNMAVTTFKLAPNSVTFDKLTDGAVIPSKIGAGGALPNQTLIYNGINVNWRDVDWFALANVPSGFGDGLDNDTTYSAGAGLALSGTQFAIAPMGVANAMLANAAVTPVKLNADGATNGQALVYEGARVVWTNVAWNSLAGIPAGFADGSDDGAAYSAGAGLNLSGTQFAIAPGGVVTSMLADGAVSSPKLIDGAVSTLKIAEGAVSSRKLEDAAVTVSKLGDGAVSTPKLQDLAVTTLKVADAAITGAKLAEGAVNSRKLSPLIDLGDSGTPGRLRLYHTSLGNPGIILEGTNSSVVLNGPDGVAQVNLEPGLTGGRLNLQDAVGHETTMTLAGGFNSGGTFSLFSGTGGLRADMMGAIAGGRMSFYNSSAARRLEISGEFGTVETLGSLSLLDTFGGATLATMFRQSNGGQVQVGNNSSQLAGWLGSSLSGGGFLQVYNGDGSIGVRVDGHNGNAGLVQVNNTEGSVSVRLDGHDGNSGLIQVYDTNTNLRVALDALGATGVAELSLYSSAGVANLQLSSGDAGGFVSVNQANGSRGVFLDGDAASNDGGSMTIYQGDGQIGLFLDGDSSGAGLIQVRNTNAGIRVSIDGSGTNGGGQITLLENDGSDIISLGQESASGGAHILLRNKEEAPTISLNGGTADADGYEGGRITLYGAGGYVDPRVELLAESYFEGGRLNLYAPFDYLNKWVHFSADGTSWIYGELGINRVPGANALEVNGNASKTTAGSWLANSDRRIKMNVRTITNALETIARIRPVGFRYTEDYRKDRDKVCDVEYFNVIAQEFAQVFPNAVTESGDTLPNGEKILQVDTYPATIHGIAAIQELHQLVNQKEQRIAHLESRNRSLEVRLERLEQMIANPGLKPADR